MTVVVDRSAPGVRVLVAEDEHTPAKPIDFAERIQSFAFEDSDRKADKLTLQLNNHDLALFEREQPLGGAVLEVSWGYPGHMAPPRRVVVQKIKGFTTLTVEGHALSALMHREAKSRRFGNARRSDVARMIAAQHGYEGTFLHVEDTEVVYDHVVQAAETDARFLRRLAAREGYEFFVDGTGLHFHPRRFESPPPRALHYHNDPGPGELTELSVESDLFRRAGKVTVKGRDPLRKSTIEQSASSESTDRATLAETVEVVDGDTGETRLETRNASASVQPSSASTDKEAKRQADARFVLAERKALKLSGRMVGDPSMHAKSVIELRGVPPMIAGKYYATTVRHRIDGSGYSSELQLIRDGFGPGQRRPQGGDRNQGQVRQDAELTQVEVVDGDTGETRIEYRRDGRPVGTEDPEAQVSRAS